MRSYAEQVRSNVVYYTYYISQQNFFGEAFRIHYLLYDFKFYSIVSVIFILNDRVFITLIYKEDATQQQLLRSKSPKTLLLNELSFYFINVSQNRILRGILRLHELFTKRINVTRSLKQRPIILKSYAQAGRSKFGAPWKKIDRTAEQF